MLTRRKTKLSELGLAALFYYAELESEGLVYTCKKTKIIKVK